MRTEPHEKIRSIAPNAAEDAFSLPAWIYDNDEFLELEKEQIFARSWQIVCHVSDIEKPGDYRIFELLGERVFVIRAADGVIRGFYNVCRHRAARLLDGETGNCPGRIVCPYHAWAYESSGELVWVPFEEEYGTGQTSTPAPSQSVSSWRLPSGHSVPVCCPGSR